MRNSELSRVPSWSLVFILGVLLLIACGKSPGQAPVATTGVQSGDGGQTQAPVEPPSGSGDTRLANSMNPCDSFGMLGGMAAGFAAQTADANLETSGTPGSKYAENVGDFAVGTLEDALEGDVSAGCFLEFSSDGEAGVWVALNLPDTISSGAADRVSGAMTERGASVIGAMSSASQGATFDLVSFEALPFEAPNGSDSKGALYFVAGDDGTYLAVMMASYSDSPPSADPPPAGGPSSVGGGPGGEFTLEPTGPPLAVVPSGLAKTVNDGLQPALEGALGIGLVLDSFFQTGSAGNNAITLSYAIEGPPPSSPDRASAFARVIEDLGGSVTFSVSAAEGTTAAFENVEIGGLTLRGTLALSENNIAAVLTSGG